MIVQKDRVKGDRAALSGTPALRLEHDQAGGHDAGREAPGAHQRLHDAVDQSQEVSLEAP
jgi:hypothetical protein